MIPPSIVAIYVLPSETSTSIVVAGAVTAVAPVPVVTSGIDIVYGNLTLAPAPAFSAFVIFQAMVRSETFYTLKSVGNICISLRSPGTTFAAGRIAPGANTAIFYVKALSL